MESLCPLCTMTKVEMADAVLKAVGYKKGKSKYSNGEITKIEMYHIYRFVMEKKEDKKKKKPKYIEFHTIVRKRDGYPIMWTGKKKDIPKGWKKITIKGRGIVNANVDGKS